VASLGRLLADLYPPISLARLPSFARLKKESFFSFLPFPTGSEEPFTTALAVDGESGSALELIQIELNRFFDFELGTIGKD